MNTSLTSLVILCTVCLCVEGTLKTIKGQLVNVVDNCDPADPNSCGAGKCCVKEGMAYIPEATGPKPAYVIRCQALGTAGRMCFLSMNSHETCPCASGLTCKAGVLGFFGHCS
ncbi:uncharacterized protein [Haliotis cracherodii]|uniref:uncharacterized protein LOC124116331 n=1 Tax=Haliotis rufescens TaxID=6454 RepID=UPI001EB0A5EE|nr:uncharacterized protein LOC124116331 [Haliotis rufescens]